MEIKELYQLFQASAGVNTDTRTLKENQLFVALKGESFDGNAFALKALEAGAVAAVVSDTVPEEDPRQVRLSPTR